MRRVPDVVRIDVLDRGSGMSDAVLTNALVPFYSTKRSGTGLGLALAREIAEAHGGRITLANREGGGLAVTLILPVGPGLRRSGSRLNWRDPMSLTYNVAPIPCRTDPRFSQPGHPPATITEFEGVRSLHLGTSWVQGAMRLAAPGRDRARIRADDDDVDAVHASSRAASRSWAWAAPR